MNGLASTSTAAMAARQLARRQNMTPAAAASTMARLLAQQQRGYATPHGPPPKGFRLPKSRDWDDSTESTLDRAGRFFLMSEMFRGMYVALEQYFRPP